MRILISLFAIAVSTTTVARAGTIEEETDLSNKAAQAIGLKEYDKGAAMYASLADTAESEEIRLRSEYEVGQAFLRAGYFDTAFRRFAYVIKAGANHPYYLKAVEGVVAISEALDEDYITGALLDKEYSADFSRLPIDSLNKINYIVGSVSYRKQKYDEALEFFRSVPINSIYYARSRYLTGLMYASTDVDKAMVIFEELRNMKNLGDTKYVGLQQINWLSTLALARVSYSVGKFEDSARYYSSIPRFSDFWDDALAEGGWAHFMAEDPGGALGSLQALHAPQYANSFQPESWILKATVYYEACLYGDAKDAVDGFEKVYLPAAEKIKPLLEGEKSNEYYYDLLAAKSSGLPRQVKGYLVSNGRLVKFKGAIDQLEREKRRVAKSPVFAGTALGTEMIGGIDQSQSLQIQVAGNFVKRRLDDALRMITGFQGQAEILKFEVAKGEGEILSRRMNQSKHLADQAIYRPAMPGTNWEYWQFGGEFWLDEIGYYKYTLKSGCMAKKDE